VARGRQRSEGAVRGSGPPGATRARRLAVALVAFGPGLACLTWVALRYGPTDVGWPLAISLGAVVGLGVVGLSGLVLAWLPHGLERAGLGRAAAWLRRWWDDDAR
jgi:hypothetical protein